MASTFLLCGREHLILISVQIKHNLSGSVPLNRACINKGQVIKASSAVVTVPACWREFIALNTLIVERWLVIIQEKVSGRSTHLYRHTYCAKAHVRTLACIFSSISGDGVAEGTIMVFWAECLIVTIQPFIATSFRLPIAIRITIIKVVQPSIRLGSSFEWNAEMSSEIYFNHVGSQLQFIPIEKPTWRQSKL